jgi:hypothetical protein
VWGFDSSGANQSNRNPSDADRGCPYGCTKGAKRVVALDVIGLPVAAVSPAPAARTLGHDRGHDTAPVAAGRRPCRCRAPTDLGYPHITHQG